MRHLIQVFRPSEPGSAVGSWQNTAWGDDDLAKTLATARQVAESSKHVPQSNYLGITKVRVLEVLEVFDRSPVSQPALPPLNHVE